MVNCSTGSRRRQGAPLLLGQRISIPQVSRGTASPTRDHVFNEGPRLQLGTTSPTRDRVSNEGPHLPLAQADEERTPTPTPSTGQGVFCLHGRRVECNNEDSPAPCNTFGMHADEDDLRHPVLHPLRANPGVYLERLSQDLRHQERPGSSPTPPRQLLQQ